MRIAFYVALPFGGALRTVYEQIKILSQKNDIDLYEIPISGKSSLDLTPFIRKKYTYTFKIESRLPLILNRLERDYKNFISLYFLEKKIAKKINVRGYDAAIIHSDLLTQSPYVLRFLEIPHIFHCHEPLRIVYEKEFAFTEKVPFYKRWYELSTRRIRKKIDYDNARAAKYIITSSNSIKKQVKQYYKRDATCLLSGVDSELFQPIGGKKNNLILIPGGKSTVKGYDFIMECLSLINRKFQVKTLSEFLHGGVVSDMEIVKAYSNALLSVCAAKNEPFGLTPLESAACGTLVLATDEGGYRETIKNGNNGFLLSRDPKIFAKKITYFLDNPSKAIAMGKKARKYVQANWTWKPQINGIEKILKNFNNEKA